jgi:hypothetical protein
MTVSYVSSFVRPVFFVRWMAPTASELPAVTGEFLAARKSVGQPIVYVAIVPEDCASPDETTRRGMVRERDAVLPECVSMHIVMEGSGFKHAILRNAMAAMQLVAGRRDKKVQIARSLDEALAAAARQVPADLPLDVRSIVARAIAQGVATPVARATAL